MRVIEVNIDDASQQEQDDNTLSLNEIELDCELGEEAKH